MTIAEVKDGEDYNNASSVKNDVVLINLIILGGSGGMLPQENFLFFNLWDCFWWLLSTWLGEKPVSDIHWFPYLL